MGNIWGQSVSTDGHWHQFNTNRNPHFGVLWGRKLYSVLRSSIVILHISDAALGPGPSLAGQLCSSPHWSASRCSMLHWSAPLCFGCSDLCHSALAKHLWCFSLARETQSTAERESTLSEPWENWLTWTKAPILGPGLGSPHANEDSKCSQQDWSKRHCSDWSE